MPPIRLAFVTFAIAAFAGTTPAQAPDPLDTRLCAEPAVSAEHVAFVYAEDIWLCARSGGTARRLTTHAGVETAPRFSRDGRWLAFSGEYGGNLDVYVVAVTGGEPRRLTWHPSPDLVQDFSPDGARVLFTSGRNSYTRRYTQLFEVPVAGGFPEQLPVPNAAKACYSPDGASIVYQPLGDAFPQWKHYRGGRTARLWIYDRATHAVEQIPQPDGRCNDTDPMWVGDRIWFRSDRNGEFDLFAYELGTKAVRQVTHHDDFPVLAAGACKDAIVFEQAGWLFRLDPATGASERLRIGAAADLAEPRPRWARGDRWLRSADVSPSGQRAVVEFRGEILTLPAEKGDPRYLTSTPGVHERDPVWSPDGTRIAFVADAGGEYALHVVPQHGGDATRHALPGAGFYDQLQWAPDGKKLSFVDNARTLFWIDLDTGAATRVDADAVYGPGPEPLAHHWSPDSRWIAYARILPTNFRQVFVYSLDDGTSRPVTDGLSDVGQPVFDRGGKYLFLAGSTDAGPVRQWFAMSNADMEAHHALYVAVLAKGEPSPLSKKSDEEQPKAAKAEEPAIEAAADKPAGARERAKDAAPVAVRIDFDGLPQRIVDLPIAPLQLGDMAAGAAGTLFYLERGEGSSKLHRFDLGEQKSELVTGDVQGFRVSADGNKLLLRRRTGLAIVDAKGKVDPAKGGLAVDAIRVKVEPRAEWAQIFDEAWRINRDWFYDPGMHGADWPAMKAKYAVFLPHLAVRSDLNRVIQWMCSELAVGHHRVGGGDRLDEIEAVPVGLLGCDWEIADGRYRFAKVYGGLNWNPKLRAPLTEPGVDVAAGEFLLAVDGVPLAPPDNVYARFEQTVDRIVELTVGPNADGTGARTVRAVPIGSEAALRNRAWVEGNVAKVHAATGGRVAYVYVPNTAGEGHEYFKRYFFPQADKQAIIVDERHNGGGQIADYYVDLLLRRPSSWWTTRYGQDFQGPLSAIAGPKVLLADETAGSGGDLFPYMWRRAGLGPIVGKTTWGGLVGVLGFPTLLDGGSVSAPNVAFWNEDGFRIENEGVPPDIEVEQWPADVIAGHDPQLERAIAEVLRLLEQNPPSRPQRPPFPVRAR